MKRILGLAVLFTAAYLLIFSTPLRTEPTFTPKWVQNLSNPAKVASASTGETVGFRIGDVFGYATSDGEIKYLNTAQFNVAMADGRFINYSSVSKNLVEKDSSGRIVMTVASRGYPVFRGNRLFVLSTDRTSLSELNQQGETVWSRDFGSLITAMDANSERVVVGLLNGSAVVVGAGGKVLFRYVPGGSKVPIIYGCAISTDGSQIALVSGLDPQRFILLGPDKTGYRPRRVVDLGSDERQEVFLHFFPKVPYVYIELPNEIGYFSTDGSGAGKIKVPGRVEAMSESGNLIYVVSERSDPAETTDSAGANRAELTVFSPPGAVISRSSFAAGALYLKTRDKSAYLGTNRRLMRIDYGRE